MGLPQTPSSPHLYPQALQLKLYQAFIFSIPILFSIILFLLFYLFYLKRRASTLSSPPPILPRTFNQTTTHPFIPMPCEGLKGKLKEKLPIILFDEDLKARDSQCCVCLGEFEMKEELLQLPLCKHLFHIDCIHHWLCSNSTCPLCRCSVIPTTKLGNSDPPSQQQQDNHNSSHHPQFLSLQQQQQDGDDSSTNIHNLSSEPQAMVTPIEESVISIENEMGCPDGGSVVLHIQTHNS